MDTNDELRDIISAALTEVADPAEQDNPDEVEAVELSDEPEGFEDEAVDEPADDESVDDEAETDEEDVEEDDESEDDSPTLDETFVVKVDGEEVEITVREALQGYQRQADYTRKTQELAEARKAFEEEIQGYGEVLEDVQAFEAAWEENPTGVVARLVGGTDNPTLALVLTIKELAVAGQLEKGFLETFGIDDDLIKDWSRDVEVNTLRGQVSRTQAQEQEAREIEEYQRSVQSAVQQYERQIDEIIAEEGLALDANGREQFKVQVARYAQANQLTNLKAARKAMLFEEGQKKQVLTERTRERAKQKKQSSAVTRKGSGGAGTPVSSDPDDLRSLIEATMRDLS
jgi:hypothetical protein